jgi:hypothetical protein
MSKRKSQPPSPAATIVTMLPHHLEAGPCCPVRSHPLGDFEDEPAEGGEASAPEKHERHPRVPFLFFTGHLRP